MDKNEMELIHSKYDLLIRSVIRRICRDVDNRDDLYQETFVKIFNSDRRPNNSDSERNWVITICINCYRDVLRKGKRAANAGYSVTYDSEALDILSDQGIAAIDKMIQDETCLATMNVVKSLDDKYRIPIVLYYFLNKKVEDVANVMRIPQNTVLTRLRRGREIIRKRMCEENE